MCYDQALLDAGQEGNREFCIPMTQTGTKTWERSTYIMLKGRQCLGRTGRKEEVRPGREQSSYGPVRVFSEMSRLRKGNKPDRACAWSSVEELLQSI